MSTPSIKVGQGNWGIKALSLLGYANTDKKFVARDFTVGRLLNTATRVNASGTIEGVNANIPRIDYFGGQASLLVEPSAQNLALQSAGFQVSGTWFPENVTITTGTTSAFTAPDGSTDADLLTDNTTLGKHRVSQGSLSFTSGITYAFSVFVKKNSSGRFLLLNANTAFGARAALNLDTLAITNIDGSGASVENYGNGWYRFLIRGTATSTQTTSVLIQMQDAATDASYIGNGSSFYLWGAQLETGSVATSYIPTTTGTVTRNADVISVTGVAGLIGQTEGTIYAEVVLSRVNANQIISLGSTNDRIAIFFDSSTGIYAFIRVGGAPSDYNATIPAIPATGGVYKIALAYKANDYCFAVNGVAYNPSTASRGVPANMSAVYLGASVFSTGQLNDRIRAVSIYQTRLPNTTTDGSPSLQSITTL